MYICMYNTHDMYVGYVHNYGCMLCICTQDGARSLSGDRAVLTIYGGGIAGEKKRRW